MLSSATQHTMRPEFGGKKGTESTHPAVCTKQHKADNLYTYILIQIRWAEQLFVKNRVKRYPLANPDKKLHRVKRIDEASFEDDAIGKPLYRENRIFNDELWGYEWYLVRI